jgi:16S rRNA (cytosine1402-N4)-methyltransferase
MLEKKPKKPSPSELKENFPSRSAKLRYIIKKNDLYKFETDIFQKFSYLIEIENFGNKL